MTQVFVESSGRRIAPFDDPVTETLIQNKPLSYWQSKAFQEAGLTQIDTLSAPCLVVPDTLFTTAGALKAFIEGAAGRDAVLVLKDSLFGKNSVPVQPHVTPVEAGWRFEKIRFVASDQAPVDVVVDPEEQVFEVPVPKVFVGSDSLEMGMARHPVITLHHWVHILWANQFVGGAELRSTPVWKLALKGLWGVLRALSFNKWKVLGKLNTIGKGCDIHPTAIVEGSTLGDGVSVGPYARVLFSTVGDNASIMQGAQVELSVMGERAMVTQQSVIRFCVLYPGAAACQYLMQQCVLGRDAVTTGGAFSIDLNFESDIRVPLDGQLQSTGMRFLGSAFGHRARIGTGFWMASGRSVPNDYFLIRHPDQVLSRIAGDLPADGSPLVVDGTRLRPLEDVLADRKSKP